MDVPEVAALPRLAHFILERHRLLERCTPSNGIPKLILAPAGYGKTVLATQFARLYAGRYAYIALREEHDGVFVERVIRTAIESGRHLLIDDAHRASEDCRQTLRRMLATLDAGVDAIVCSRTAEGIVDRRSLFDGSTDVIDASELAFSVHELRTLCARLGVVHNDQAMRRFQLRTGCWPIAVSGALRVAGERGLMIDEAVDVWYQLHGTAFARFIADESLMLPQGAGFLKHVRHPGPTSQEELKNWHASGLFVGRDGEEFRVLPVVYGVFGNEPPSGAGLQLPVRVELFSDDMRTTIGDVRVQWIRHKDTKIFKYLVMRNDVVTRTELMHIFWPGRERNIAAQNLRTTCSNIRRALRQIVGYQCVDRYFQSDGNIRISAPVMSDMDEFREAVKLARVTLSGGDSRTAREHFKRARELYRNDLLTGMPPCGFEELAGALRQDFSEALHRLRTLPELARVAATAS